MITVDDDGVRQYSLDKTDKQPGNEINDSLLSVTKSAHPARYSPDDKQFTRRNRTKLRYNLSPLDIFSRAIMVYEHENPHSLKRPASALEDEPTSIPIEDILSAVKTQYISADGPKLAIEESTKISKKSKDKEKKKDKDKDKSKDKDEKKKKKKDKHNDEEGEGNGEVKKKKKKKHSEGASD